MKKCLNKFYTVVSEVSSFVGNPVQCRVYSVQCTVYSVQCTVYSVQYSVQWQNANMDFNTSFKILSKFRKVRETFCSEDCQV